MSGAQSARGVHAAAATRRSEGGVQRPKERPICHVVVFVPGITAGMAVVVVIKQVHNMVQIIEERAQLRTAALRSAEYPRVSSEIKPIIPISLIVIAPSFQEVVVLIRKKTKSNRSRLIVVDAISARSSRLRCAQCVDKKLKMPACSRCAQIRLDRLVRVVTTMARPW